MLYFIYTSLLYIHFKSSGHELGRRPNNIYHGALCGAQNECYTYYVSGWIPVTFMEGTFITFMV